MTITVKRTCPKCGGTGTDPGIPGLGGADSKPCENCTDGYQLVGFSDDLETALDDILDKVNDVLDKCNDILEQVSE